MLEETSRRNRHSMYPMVRYQVIDAYPSKGSEFFSTFVNGVIACWIREDLFSSDRQADDLVLGNLASQGWEAASTLLVEAVTSETYKDKAEGRAFYQQCLLDGFVANVNRVKRETVGVTQHALDIVSNYHSVISTISEHGAFILTSGKHIARGTAENSDEYVPLWVERPDASWRSRWPRYKSSHVEADELLTILEELSNESLFCGLGRGSGLVTFHPVGIYNDLRTELGL
jgi:hypothetical protein